MLRSCYDTVMDFGDGVPVPIRWFFTDDDAEIFPGMNRFGSLNWLPAEIPDDGPGEILGEPRPWRDGSYPIIPRGKEPDGPLEDFANGCDFEKHPLLELNEVGIPVKCVPTGGAYDDSYSDAYDV